MSYAEYKIESELENLIKTNKSIGIDCLILNEEGNVFAQKRSSNRKKYPNCWDLPGGTLEKNETAIECIARELKEELDFELEKVVEIVHIHEFDLPKNMRNEDENYQFRIIQVIVKVKDYTKPVLEAGKVTTYDWFGIHNLDRLMEGREDMSDTYIYDAVSRVIS